MSLEFCLCVLITLGGLIVFSIISHLRTNELEKDLTSIQERVDELDKQSKNTSNC